MLISTVLSTNGGAGEGGSLLMMKDSPISADLKCFMEWVRDQGEGPLMMTDFLYLLISNVLGKGVWSWEGGTLMTMKDSLVLLISNILGLECGAGERPTNDGEGFSVFC